MMFVTCDGLCLTTCVGCVSLQLALRCLIHMELAKSEEDVDHLKVAEEHVRKVSIIFIYRFTHSSNRFGRHVNVSFSVIKSKFM